MPGISLNDIFADFLLLRIYMPGLIFVILNLFVDRKNEINIMKKISEIDNYPILLFIILPIVAGQLIHIINASLSLFFGFEQIESIEKPICSRIEKRIKKSIYLIDQESAKRIFQFAQIYANITISLILFLILNWRFIYANEIIYTIFFIVFAIFSSVSNYFYGRGILILYFKKE